jgi:hypothetical protein
LQLTLLTPTAKIDWETIMSQLEQLEDDIQSPERKNEALVNRAKSTLPRSFPPWAMFMALFCVAVACSNSGSRVSDAADAQSDAASTAEAAADAGAGDAQGLPVLTTPGPCPSDKSTALRHQRVACYRDCTPERENLYLCTFGGGTAAPQCYRELATGNLYVASMQSDRLPPADFALCTDTERDLALFGPRDAGSD